MATNSTALTTVAKLTGNEYDSLTKTQKLAYFFILLGPEAAAPIMKQFDESKIEEICREMAQIKMIDRSTQTKIISEFSNIIGKSIEGVLGGADYTKKTLALAQGDYKAASILGKVLQDSSCSRFSKELESMDTRQIFNLIQYEQPQTIAFILSGLSLEKAVSLLSLFPGERKEDILVQLGTMEPISLEMIGKIVKSLQTEAREGENKAVDAIGGPMAVANILNALDRDSQKLMLARLEEKDNALVGAIRKHMFTFEDLAKLSVEDLQKLSREIDTADLVVAMKSASQIVKNAIFGAMSKRAAEALKEEIEMLGPVRLKAIEAAREKIIQVVRKLEESGEITIGNSDENKLIK